MAKTKSKPVAAAPEKKVGGGGRVKKQASAIEQTKATAKSVVAATKNAAAKAAAVVADSETGNQLKGILKKAVVILRSNRVFAKFARELLNLKRFGNQKRRNPKKRRKVLHPALIPILRLKSRALKRIRLSQRMRRTRRWPILSPRRYLPSKNQAVKKSLVKYFHLNHICLFF